jgi:acetoin utilization deacetylase AcuC-like enzyme
LCGGYCFLNNAAIAADWLSKHRPDGSVAGAHANRIAILDVDFHHGNGTQDIFYERDDVLVVSIHGNPDRQYPYYIGAQNEHGSARGEGYNVNYPLEAGVTDTRYLAVLEQACGTISDYHATSLVVSLGVDTFMGDPLGDFALTSAVYPRIGKAIAQLNLPTVFIMEGGYAIALLGQHIASTLAGFEEAR